MPIKVIITKTLEDWWGADDLRSDYPDDEQFTTAVIELCMEDTPALLDGATWEIVETDTEPEVETQLRSARPSLAEMKSEPEK